MQTGENTNRSALKLFLSYRRDDSAAWAGRLFDSLSSFFAPTNIFMDVDSIPAGAPFEDLIQDSIASSDLVLVLIGKNWAGAEYKDSRRIDRPSDVVRLEISAALSSHKQTIPVLVDGARPPLPEELPEEIASLAKFNAIELTHSRWRYDVERLIDAILRVDRVAPLISRLCSGTRSGALESLRQIEQVLRNADVGARQRTFEILKDVFCQPRTSANADSAAQDRDVRKVLWRCMRDFVTQTLESCFTNGELAGIDLYGMDFRGAQLKGVSLNRSFLVESDFGQANLQGASLSGSRIRNVNFADTCLNATDMTDADWYNATGLTAQQLAVVKPGTLRRCPPAMKDIIDSLADDYAYPFGSWSRRIQQELQQTWKRYIEDDSFVRLRAQ